MIIMDILMNNVFDRPFNNSLHGLRGLASLSVLLSHFIGFILFSGFVMKPLRFFDAGLPAVSLFFVMSGAVLGISLRNFRADRGTYLAYLVRRFLRLWPVIALSTLLGYTVLVVTPDLIGDQIYTSIFHRYVASSLGASDVILSLSFASSVINPPLWSISVEVIASILLPFMAIASRRLAGCLYLCLACLLLAIAVGHRESIWFIGHWPAYLINFALGLLACHLALWARPWIGRMPGWLFVMVVVGLYLGLMNTHSMIQLPMKPGHFLGNLCDLAFALPLVVLLMERDRGFAGLASGIGRFLGDTSYSVYLLHWPIMVGILAIAGLAFGPATIMAHGELFSAGLLSACLIVTLLAASLSYRYVEKPAVAAGRALARLRDRAAKPADPASETIEAV